MVGGMRTLIHSMLAALMLGCVGATPAEDEAYLRSLKAATGNEGKYFPGEDEQVVEAEKKAAKKYDSSLTAGQGVLLGLGVFGYLALIVLAVLWVLIPWMIYRMHGNLKVMLGVLKYQTKALEAMNANLISISQQINHFGTGQPMPRVHAPVQGARGEAPKSVRRP